MIGKGGIWEDLTVVLVVNHAREIKMSDNIVTPYYI